MERFKPRVKPASGPDFPVTVIAARSGVEVEATTGQSLLDALISVGVRVDSSCRNGVCGTCQVRVLAGEPDHRDDVLTAAGTSPATPCWCAFPGPDPPP